jgi:hypothetical protein
MAAMVVAPPGTVGEIRPPASPDGTTRVIFEDPAVPEGWAHTVFVEPYTGRVRGAVVDRARSARSCGVTGCGGCGAPFTEGATPCVPDRAPGRVA